MGRTKMQDEGDQRGNTPADGVDLLDAPQKEDVLQAGGHQDRLAIDSLNPRKLVKKTLKTELDFYQSFVLTYLDPQQQQLDIASSSHESSSNAPALSTLNRAWSGWRPKFYGSLDAFPGLPSPALNNNEAIIILENLTFGRPTRARAQDSTNRATSLEEKGDETEGFQAFVHPNVIDIKLGQRLYDDQAPLEKQERMKKAASDTTSAKFGVRLTGAKLWNNLAGNYLTIPKAFGKAIDPAGTDLQVKFNSLFPISDTNNQSDSINNQDKELEQREDSPLTHSKGSLPATLLKQIIDRSIVPKIKKIRDKVASFNWRVYGSSLLIVFEADLETLLSQRDSDVMIEDTSLIKMIDFAHVHQADNPDPGLLKGFQTTLDLFNQLSLQLAHFNQQTTS